jgi:hypothetical protein
VKRCHSCQKVIESRLPLGRREECVFCGAELHCCLNCKFYSPGSYNDCREPQAERVTDKNRSNFCDLFVFQDSDLPNAKEKLKSLFKGG